MTNIPSANTINERINLIIEALDISANAFAQELGVAGSVIYNILKGRNKPSFDILNKIVSSFDINPNYLLTGKGDIFASNNEVLEMKSLRSGDNEEDYALFLKQWNKVQKTAKALDKAESNKYYEVFSKTLTKIADITNHYSLETQGIAFLNFATKQVDDNLLIAQVKKMLELEEEVINIIKPFETQLALLFKKLDDFNEKHDNIHHIDDDDFEKLLREVDEEMNTPKG